MFDSILVVCVGNICRSPTGERLLKKRLPEKTVSSAGIAALVDKPADSMACAVAERHGLSLDGHVARQLSAKLCRDSDLILVMEKKQIELVSQIDPAVRGKTMLYGHWLNGQEIADPYRKGEEVFEHIYELLENASREWVNALSR